MNDFLSNQQVNQLTKAAEGFKKEGKRFSDMEDAEGNQYVDLVQEGGGVLGVALVGYTYILEKAGLRFFSLAGTSAGAINTLMIAALGRIQEAKSEKILQILSHKNLFDLVDGDRPVRRLVQRAIRGESGIGWTLAWNAVRFYRILTRRLGLNPGNDFEKWIDGELAKAGIHNMGDLNKLRQQIPVGLRCVSGSDISGTKPKLAIIAADITTHSKIEFPRMSELFFSNPDTVSPAKLVRASMSIPIFFEPVTLSDIPNKGSVNNAKWFEHCRYKGEVPAEVSFVDGGLLSNFPINVFHRRDGKIPRKPTFGVRLSTYREEYSQIKGLKSMMGAMISSMRQIYDYDFLKRNPDYSQLICHVDADKDFNWLDFEISREDQIKMFVHGATEAVKFLEGFNWIGYKEIRKEMAQGGHLA